MKKILTYYFIISLLLGSGIYLCDKTGIELPNWVRFYVNDFLIVPIILFISLKVLRWSKNDALYTISLPLILYVCVLYSALFEFIFPTYLLRYTYDVLDIALYFTSGFVFYFLQKEELAI